MAKHQSARKKGKPTQDIITKKNGKITVLEHPEGRKITPGGKMGYQDENGFGILRDSNGYFHV